MKQMNFMSAVTHQQKKILNRLNSYSSAHFQIIQLAVTQTKLKNDVCVCVFVCA